MGTRNDRTQAGRPPSRGGLTQRGYLGQLVSGAILRLSRLPGLQESQEGPEGAAVLLKGAFRLAVLMASDDPLQSGQGVECALSGVEGRLSDGLHHQAAELVELGGEIGASQGPQGIGAVAEDTADA